VYVSNMADNSVQAYNPVTGAVRTLTSGKLAVPSGVKVDGNTLWVADVFAFRTVDIATGAVSDVKRMHATDSDMEYPFAVGVSSKQVAIASWFTGWVQVLDRATKKTIANLHGWKAPYDVLPMEDGSLLVAEIATGSITQASGAGYATRRVVASGLAGPVQMALGRDGALYVTEAAGKLTRVNLADGSKTEVASGLALPEGVAQTPWGSFIVAETAAARLVEIDPASGQRRTVAENLPIGLSAGPGLPPPGVATGVTVDANGTIYFTADRNNALYRIRPQR
jgi:streptogramin lyase